MLPNLSTLDEIFNRVSTDVEASYEKSGIVVDAVTPGTGLTEFAKVRAAESYANQQHFVWIAQQLLIDSMDDDVAVARAAEKGVYRSAGNASTGTVIVQGNNGATIARGEVLEAASGLAFVVIGDTVVAANSAVLSVRCQTVGIAGNLASGAPLVFVTPVAGIVSDAAVIGNGLAGGADIESISRLKSRFKTRLQKPPRGGSDYDYEQWALEAHVDVTRVWVTSHEGSIGRVVVRFVTEDLQSPIPSPQHRQAVAAYIDNKRPAGIGSFDVEAPIAKPLNLNFTSLTPNNPTVQAAIDAELDAMLRREGQAGGTLPLSHIRATISNAPGEFDYTLSLNENIALSDNQFPTRGVTTWP